MKTTLTLLFVMAVVFMAIYSVAPTNAEEEPDWAEEPKTDYEFGKVHVNTTSTSQSGSAVSPDIWSSGAIRRVVETAMSTLHYEGACADGSATRTTINIIVVTGQNNSVQVSD